MRGRRLTGISPLINQVTNFLDGISEELEIEIDRLRTDKGYFEEVYLMLKENLEELKAFKDEMELRGFDAPYFALGFSKYKPSGKHSYMREDIEDQRDISRHKKFFRSDASFKKGTFERAKSSIASHNIAIGHLEEVVCFECDCGKVAKGKEATKVIEDKGAFTCSKCGSEEAVLKENSQGVHRLGLLSFLPYGGECTSEISKFSPTERMAYREIVEVLREKKRGKIRSATVSFRALQDGKWTKRKERVELEMAPGMDYENFLREKYGKLMIDNIRFYHERSILISGKYNRQTLAIAYTKILRRRRGEILDFLLGMKVDIEKLRTYESLRRELDSSVYVEYPTFSLDMRLGEERKELMDEFEEKLKVAGLMDARGELDPALEEAISYKQELRKTMLGRIPKFLFAWDMFKFLLIKPYRERRYASIFPGLQPIPEEEQLESALSILHEAELLSAVNEFLDEAIVPIEGAHNIIFSKFEIEEVLKDYLKVTSSRAVGGISLYLDSTLDIQKSAEVVSSELNELEDVLKILIRLGREDLIPPEKLESLEGITLPRNSVLIILVG